MLCRSGSKEGVYFIAASGTTRSLHEIDATDRPILVARNFGYDSLSAGGNPRWLVSQDYRSKEIVIVDTETDAIKWVGKHKSGTVLSDGKLLLATGPEITVGDASCRPNAKAETLNPKNGNSYLQIPVVASGELEQIRLPYR